MLYYYYYYIYFTIILNIKEEMGIENSDCVSKWPLVAIIKISFAIIYLNSEVSFA